MDNPALNDSSERIGLGIVGFGKIAQDQHLAAIAGDPGFFLHSVADHREIQAPVQRFPDIETMLDAPDRPDAVSICTPPQVRFDIARQALNRQVHVLLEKPPCVTAQQAQTLSELAAQSDVTLFCAWHSQFAPAVLPALEWLGQRRARRVRIEWREDVRVWHPGQQWIWEPGGFGVFDAGINAISIATKILPGPLAVDRALLRIPEQCAAPVAAELALTDRNGTEISASFDFLQPGPPIWEIEIETDSGLLQIIDGGSRLTVDGQESSLGPNREYAAVYSRFATLIDNHRSDVDLAPFLLAMDVFRLGHREIVPPLDLLFSKPLSPEPGA